MTIWVALWYSVVITPSRRIRSDDLIAMAEACGLAGPRTVLSTGNLIFTAVGNRARHERALEGATRDRLGRAIPVFCRTADEWRAIVAENPFPDETKDDPARVAVRIMRQMPDEAAVARMARAAVAGERFAATPGGLWLATANPVSGGRLLAAVGSDWAGEGTFRSASSIGKIAAALG